MLIIIAALTVLLLCPQHMAAQKKKFSLEQIGYGGRQLLRGDYLWTTWWGDQLMYLDISDGGTLDANGQRTKLFSLSDIKGNWYAAYEAVYPYPGETLVMLDNSHERILYDWKKKETVWEQTSQDETHTDWNARSRNVAYVKEHQLYVRTAANEERRLTTDGSREIVYGQSVHRNEFGIEKGTFWSPDGQKLAFYRMDQSMVSDYPQVDINPRCATYEPDKYPMAGETSHKVTVGVYDVPTGKTIYLQAGDPTDRYFTNIAWSPDSKTVYMFELNRDQNDCQLVSYDAATGERQGVLYEEKHPKYVEPLHPIRFLPWDADKFIMQSQRDGYNHLYLYNKEGKLLRQLTKGEYVVMEVLGFNEKSRSVIIKANKNHPLCHNLFSVDVKNGKLKPLDNGQGVHYGELSATGQQLIDINMAPEVTRNIDLINTTDGKTQRLLTSRNPWEGYEIPIFESGSIKAADGVTDLYYRMVKPADFDATKKYPTVVYVYGGPHANNVEASWHWGSRPWETYMAQKGYVLFILDNRGSQYRGREFEQATFRQLGQIEMQDQMEGVKFLKSQPYVDADRIGVHGWSFGGFMTISLMLNYPDVFKVGVAGGPVIDWKWYEVMYGERYMDTPQTNPEGYEKTSLINKAGNLKGKLQIISGYNDNTVVPQHCLSFLKACIDAGTQPDFFFYPEEEHNMRGHRSIHLHERITQYFEDYLK
ncbi:MAG: DPP IV N-terminal domain-containing protein [Prevotella sp.]|nr:DPP IV N-terminal domain-containing protein [Prevotella sp.]